MPQRVVLPGTEDRLPGEVVRWGWCRVCQQKKPPGEWFGACGRGHVLNVAEVRWHPYERAMRFGSRAAMAPVCGEGECFEYDQGWLKLSGRVFDMPDDDFETFAEVLRRRARGIKYRSPKVTWRERLVVDAANAVEVWLAGFAEQRAHEKYEARAVADREADAGPAAGYPEVFYADLLDELMDVEL